MGGLATEVYVDPARGVMQVRNGTDVATSDIMAAVDRDPQLSAVLREVGQWAQETQGGGGSFTRRAGGLFERDRFVTPDNIFDQMKLAYRASEEDDVIGGFLEATESMAMKHVTMTSDDAQQEDILEQVAEDIELDERMREIWQELLKVSNVYVGVWWGRKTYKVRAKTDKGNQARKEFKNLLVPTALTLLDPLKIVPMGSDLFNNDVLVYVADRNEDGQFHEIVENRQGGDAIVARFIMGRFTPNEAQRKRLGELRIAADRLWLLNPSTVFRITATRPQYQQFAAVRMRSIFELLDLKHQLRQMDRAHLIGGTNFIVLVTKGTDQLPGQPSEVANLQMQVRTLARVPVLVGDHRLNVEIVTPKLDNTLKAERYNAIDSRITGRLYQLLVSGNYSVGVSGDDSLKLTQVIAQGMEAKRQRIKNRLERLVWKRVFEDNDEITEMPHIRFIPGRIVLQFDAAFASFLLDLREAGEISREHIHETFDIDQDQESKRRELEKERYDKNFKPPEKPATAIAPGARPLPPGAPLPEGPDGPGADRRRGREGQRRGGAAPGSGQGQPPRRFRDRANPGRPGAQPTRADSELADALEQAFEHMERVMDIAGLEWDDGPAEGTVETEHEPEGGDDADAE